MFIDDVNTGAIDDGFMFVDDDDISTNDGEYMFIDDVNTGVIDDGFMFVDDDVGKIDKV